MSSYSVGRVNIELVTGDIVAQDVDAVVNAANEGLAEGDGVCGAIFAAAGSRELAGAYRSSLALAARYGLVSVAFPSISTGIFGYPLEDAAGVALGAVREELTAESSVTLVRFVLWGRESYEAYKRVAVRLGLGK